LKTLGFAQSGTAEWSRGTHSTAAISESMFFGLFNSHNSQQQQSLEDNVPSSSTTQHVVHSKRSYSFVSFIGPKWRVASGDNEQQQRQRQDSDNSSTLGQEEQPVRQHSENSTSELERQLNKEPSIKYNEDPLDTMPDDDALPPPMAIIPQKEEGDVTESTAVNSKPYIQYEIQCHILFRDPSSFSGSSTTTNNTHSNNIHHSWSIWKRYSELQTLDEELRYDFGWQMDALNDGKGFVFPSSHGLESWWYGFRNGGAGSTGVMTSLLGDGGERATVISGTNRSNNDNHNAEDDGSGWGSSLYGMFARDDNSTKVNNGTPADNENNSSFIASDNPNTCPFPTSFIERRRKELASYWTNLMKIEDIFEFGDMHSHKFGKAMASFLEVDKVLLSRKNASLSSLGTAASSVASSHLQQQQYPSMAAIHENETEMFGRTSFRPSYDSTLSPTREVSGLTIHDDDVSVLSDGTGAFGDPAAAHHNVNGSSPIRGNLVVDVVPKHYPSGSNSMGNNGTTSEKQVQSSSSVASSSVNSSSRRRRSKAPRAKPAFQRQLLSP